MKRLFILASIVATLSACSTDADIASNNMSKAADNFEVNRRGSSITVSPEITCLRWKASVPG